MTKTIGEVADVVENGLNEATHKIGSSLREMGSEDLVIEHYFIVKNGFWDKWLQKLLSQLISLKVWALAIITVLIFFKLITGAEFIIGFSIIMGAKGGKDIVMKWVSNRSVTKQPESIIDKV